MRRNPARCAAALLALAACNHSQPTPDAAAYRTTTAAQPGATGADRSWIARSNENAKILLAVQARFAPEQAARLGQPGLDDRITDLSPGHQERLRKATGEALARFEPLAIHDAILAQGLLPPDLLRKAVLDAVGASEQRAVSAR